MLKKTNGVLPGNFQKAAPIRLVATMGRNDAAFFCASLCVFGSAGKSAVKLTIFAYCFRTAADKQLLPGGESFSDSARSARNRRRNDRPTGGRPVRKRPKACFGNLGPQASRASARLVFIPPSMIDDSRAKPVS